METTILEQLCAAIQQAWDEGCPIATGNRTAQEQAARIAPRRWRSFQRRRVKPSIEARVRDLTKGLIQAYGCEPVDLGPVRKHFEDLARCLAEVLASTQTVPDSSS
jgi:hypothetical protein